MEEIKKVLIVCRPAHEEAQNLSTKVVNYLKEKNIVTYSHPQRPVQGINTVTPEILKNEINLVLVLGGDGTYLEAVRFLNGLDTPILGINLGSLGFLTNISDKDALNSIEQALNNKLEKKPRSMLEVQCTNSQDTKITHSLNDAIIERGESSRLVHIEVYRNGQLVCAPKSDGLIISTPTGSTAYNLAAGGPLVYPYSNVFVVTPIAPHSLTSRPIIFCDEDILEFNLMKDSSGSAELIVDGRHISALDINSKVVIKKSKFIHQVLRREDESYFKLLRDKLQFGQRN